MHTTERSRPTWYACMCLVMESLSRMLCVYLTPIYVLCDIGCSIRCMCVCTWCVPTDVRQITEKSQWINVIVCELAQKLYRYSHLCSSMFSQMDIDNLLPFHLCQWRNYIGIRHTSLVSRYWQYFRRIPSTVMAKLNWDWRRQHEISERTVCLRFWHYNHLGSLNGLWFIIDRHSDLAHFIRRWALNPCRTDIHSSK